MTREQAIQVLINRYNSGGTRRRKDAEWRLATETVIDALRGSQPDPDTGLAPCGCGGKAHIINSSGYSHRLYVECDRCDIVLGVEATGDGALQGIYRYDDQIIKDWNRAMGYREEEGHD